MGNEASNATAKTSALHGPLASDIALGSFVCTFLYHTVLSSWQDGWTSTQGNKF
jgi:hypothetical protein